MIKKRNILLLIILLEMIFIQVFGNIINSMGFIATFVCLFVSMGTIVLWLFLVKRDPSVSATKRRIANFFFWFLIVAFIASTAAEILEITGQFE